MLQALGWGPDCGCSEGVDPTLSAAETRFLLEFAVGGGVDGRRASLEQVAGAQRRVFPAEGQRFRLAAFLNYFTTEDMMRKQFSTPERQERFLQRFLRRNCCDIFITHDWPEGILDVPQGESLRGSRPLGNPVAREVCNALRPKLHLCGHMHRPWRAEVSHDGVLAPTQVCCVSRVGFPLSLALFEYHPDTGEIHEVCRPSEEELRSRLCLNAADGDGEPSSEED